MKEFWSMVQLVFTGIGDWLGYFLGGCYGLILALLLFVVADYITGIMCAIADKKLSSEVGFKGICRKVLIFMLVGIANVLDVQVIGNGSILRTAVIFFSISVMKGFLCWRMRHIWDCRFRRSLRKCWSNCMREVRKFPMRKRMVMSNGIY